MSTPPKKNEGAPAPKSKKKLFIIIAIALIVLIAGGVGAMLMLKKKTTDKKHAPEKEEEVVKTPVFLAMEPFVVNLQSEESGRYLQVQITLQLEDESASNAIKANLPQVKSRLLMLLSNKTATEILTVEGKQKLANEIMEQINLPFSPKGEKQKVISVFFTNFVIQ